MGKEDRREPMEDLLGRAQAGDRGAQHELFLAQAPGLYRYAFHLSGRHADAEDLVQETLLKALAALPGFRGECAFQGWLFRIAMNAYLNLRRARQTRPEARTLPATGGPVAPPQGSGPDPDLRERVRAAVDRLPPRQQEVILLHTYERMDSQEIARVLGCSYESVRMNLSLARKRLRDWLANDLAEEER